MCVCVSKSNPNFDVMFLYDYFLICEGSMSLFFFFYVFLQLIDSNTSVVMVDWSYSNKFSLNQQNLVDSLLCSILIPAFLAL